MTMTKRILVLSIVGSTVIGAWQASLAVETSPNAIAAEKPANVDEVSIALANGSPPANGQAVLFAIDDRSFTRTRGVMLQMETPVKHSQNPVLKRGEEDAVDFLAISSPAVVFDGGKWRMWYASNANADYKSGRIAYAESEDGIFWHKPNLGLVEFGGGKENNLVDAAPGLCWTVSVLHDPSAPAERRFVMAGEDIRHWGASGGWSLAKRSSITRVDTSSDGLRWKSLNDGPGFIEQQHEAHTIYKFGGYYHLGGHQISPLLKLPLQRHALGGYLGPRTFVVWRSPVLDRWPVEHTKAFFKPMRSSSPYRTGWDREEVHLGASVTTFDNVCVGVYGQWHHPINAGSPKYEAKSVSCDLGLVISNDGLRFREPAPGFTFLKRDQELRWDRLFGDNEGKDNLLLDHGSIVNGSKQTFIYYSATSPGGNVSGVHSNIGLATLPRDRFGCLREIPGTPGEGQVVSCPITVQGSVMMVVNADVAEGTTLSIELLDKDGFAVLSGFEAQTLASGLDVPVQWTNARGVPRDVPFRIRVRLSDGARLYAVYLRPMRA